MPQELAISSICCTNNTFCMKNAERNDKSTKSRSWILNLLVSRMKTVSFWCFRLICAQKEKHVEVASCHKYPPPPPPYEVVKFLQNVKHLKKFLITQDIDNLFWKFYNPSCTEPDKPVLKLAISEMCWNSRWTYVMDTFICSFLRCLAPEWKWTLDPWHHCQTHSAQDHVIKNKKINPTVVCACSTSGISCSRCNVSQQLSHCQVACVSA